MDGDQFKCIELSLSLSQHFIDRIMRTFRRQYPICLVYAITGHGLSLDNIRVNLLYISSGSSTGKEDLFNEYLLWSTRGRQNYKRKNIKVKLM